MTQLCMWHDTWCVLLAAVLHSTCNVDMLQVLEKDGGNVKALYRRAQVHISSFRFTVSGLSVFQPIQVAAAASAQDTTAEESTRGHACLRRHCSAAAAAYTCLGVQRQGEQQACPCKH